MGLEPTTSSLGSTKPARLAFLPPPNTSSTTCFAVAQALINERE